jgi:hypothetical protein
MVHDNITFVVYVYVAFQFTCALPLKWYLNVCEHVHGQRRIVCHSNI